MVQVNNFSSLVWNKSINLTNRASSLYLLYIVRGSIGHLSDLDFKQNDMPKIKWPKGELSDTRGRTGS